MELAISTNQNMGQLSKNAKDGNGKTRPIVLTACLVVDILCFLLSFSLIFLFANNAPRMKKIDTSKTIDIGENTMQDVMNLMTYGIFTTIFCWIPTIFLLISSLVVLLGDKKYDFLRKEIGKELELIESSVNDVKCCIYI